MESIAILQRWCGRFVRDGGCEVDGAGVWRLWSGYANFALSLALLYSLL